MSYNFGAASAPTPSPRDVAVKAVYDELDRFETIVRQGARDIQPSQPTLATALINSIPRVRNGAQNVLDGKLDVYKWIDAVNALIEQVRVEAPWFSLTTLRSVGDSMSSTIRWAVTEIAKTTKSGLDTLGVDPNAIMSTVKWVAGGAIAIGLVYLVAITPKPGRR